MFSDTHFHFKHMTENPEVDGVQILTQMAEKNCRFGLEIGTLSNDLAPRQDKVERAISQIKDVRLADRVRNFIYFSAGIWPDIDSIHNRFQKMEELKESIKNAENAGDQDILHRKIIAIGEGGIDHHWNPAGVDGRCESDFDQKTYEGERELFVMQLELARQMNLPFIVHSRDGFEDTLECIKTAGWNKGIIHCCSYGLEEVTKFLELGWYISFSGSVTYTKRSKMEDMQKLLRYIPQDRILCETDSPYLAPVPFRGKPDNPLLVEYTYNFVAQARGTSPQELSETVDRNVENLFGITLGSL